MQPSQGSHQNLNNPSAKRPFSPYVVNTLKVGVRGFYSQDCVSYNETHNLIISSSMDKCLQFYNATTLLPSEEFETQVLDNEVLEMSFCQETETFLLRCEEGDISVYNLSSQTLQRLRPPVETISIFAAAFFNSSNYVFSAFEYTPIFIGNLENRDEFYSFGQNGDIHDLIYLPKRNLLYSSLENRSVLIFRTDRLPKLPRLYKIEGNLGYPKNIQSITINGKDYILLKIEKRIEIWHFIKGKMRQVQAIQMPKNLHFNSMVYLENYKMIATTHHTQEIKFWGLFSGKLECTLDIGIDHCFFIFLMKDKNAIGVLGWNQNIIKFIQLHPPEING